MFILFCVTFPAKHCFHIIHILFVHFFTTFLFSYLSYTYIITKFLYKIKERPLYQEVSQLFTVFRSVTVINDKNGGSHFKNLPVRVKLFEVTAAAFLLPSLEDVIQCRIQGSPHAFLYQGHDLRFKNGFLFLLSFLLLATHLIFTSLVMKISSSPSSFSSASRSYIFALCSM